MFWDIDTEVFAMWHWLVWFLSFWRTPPPSNTLKKEKFQRAVHTLYLTFFEITTAWRVKAFLSRRCFFFKEDGGQSPQERISQPLAAAWSWAFPLVWVFLSYLRRIHTHTLPTIINTSLPFCPPHWPWACQSQIVTCPGCLLAIHLCKD